MKTSTCLSAALLVFIAGCSAQGGDEGSVDQGAMRSAGECASDSSGKKPGQVTSAQGDHPDGLGQTWTDGPTLKLPFDGQEAELKNAGMGIRWGTPTTWKSYLDPSDKLLDAKSFPESPEKLVPVYALTVFVSDPSTLDRHDSDPPGTSFDSPWLQSLAKQDKVVIRFTVVRPFDVDIFVVGVRNKFKNNGFPVDGSGEDMFPDDKAARIGFNNAYQKIGWYDRGDNIDFMLWHTPEGKTRVQQILRTIRSPGHVDRVLYPSEAPGRLPYVEGGKDFDAQILTVWFGKNNDGADPGMAQARKTIIKGDPSVTF